MWLTDADRKAAEKYYEHFRCSLGTRPSAEDLAKALSDLCPEAKNTEEYIARVQSGAEQFRRAYEQCASGAEPIAPGRVLARMTESMNEAQRKGFYLQCCELIRRADEAGGVQEAAGARTPQDLAGLTEKELAELAAAQLELFAGTTAAGLAGKSAAASPLLLGAAVYAAGVRGEMPMYFAGAPELLGACAAASERLNAVDETDADRAFAIAAGIIAVLIGIAVAVLFAVFVVPELAAAAAVVDAAAAGFVDSLLGLAGEAVSSAIAGGGGGFFLLRKLLELAASSGTLSVNALPVLVGLSAAAAVKLLAERVRDFYLEHSDQIEKEAVCAAENDEEPETARETRGQPAMA